MRGVSVQTPRGRGEWQRITKEEGGDTCVIRLEADDMKTENGRKQGGGAAPCAACKLLRRRCGEECVFAPYFPADQPHKFANVHKVFGASNVNKMLQVSLSLFPNN